MPYKISHKIIRNIVCIKSIGPLKKEDYIKGSVELVDMLKKYNSQRLFVDNRLLHNKASVAELYDLVKFFDKIGLPIKCKIAILIGENSLENKKLDFFGTVCSNRGYNVQIFKSKNEMIKWLK